MEPVNPYQPPTADLESGAAITEFDQTSPISPAGRFGRLSYLAWGGVNAIVANILVVMIAGAAALTAEGGELNIAAVAIQIAFGVIGILFGIRRLHDLDKSGWWLLLALVPLVNLIFFLYILLARGTDGANRFGPPRITRRWEKVVGWIVVLIIPAALIAAISIPAYLEYVRAAGGG